MTSLHANSQPRTRPAAGSARPRGRLINWLRKEHRLGIDRVVPHYFWTMHRFNNWHKPCPRILMDGGKPGAKWQAFLKQVERA